MVVLKVACPVCGGEVTWCEESVYRPFCSLRCRSVDLGAWAEERYALPLAEEPDPDEEA
ncbi:MAG: DNA gyrase inhibitor YacG [Burkholderiaceae bacterium]|nr:DNA gyrase inhibitor YacG [Burkholderiaceae bacterium]